jgi:acetaldehyde dehydrogenase (acetylating)
MMQNTVYAIIDDTSNINTIEKELLKIEKKIQEYIPKYKIKYGHIFEENRLIIIIQVIEMGIICCLIPGI